MREVVITGYGIVSCLGNDIDAVTESLKNSNSGITINEINKELGLRSHISGSITDLNLKEKIDRKLYRFMGDAAAFAYLSAEEAIENANLSNEVLKDFRTGIIMGSGGASSEDQIDSADILRSKGLKRIGPYRVTKAMGSTVSACLATSFGIKGINYSISSACSTSAHCIGAGMEQIQLDKQDVIIGWGWRS
jgi:3-oxoacyl-(acyl-carrier-protein) synthase